MSYSIHITKSAENDIADAADYVEFVLENPIAADRLLDLTEKTIRSLSDFPHRVAPVRDEFLGVHAVLSQQLSGILSCFG